MRQLKITKQVINRETASLDKYLRKSAAFHHGRGGSRTRPFDQARRPSRAREDDQGKPPLRGVRLKQYQNQGLSLPDSINEGNLGLIKAVQRFDETRGFKFISYAVWCTPEHLQAGEQAGCPSSAQQDWLNQQDQQGLCPPRAGVRASSDARRTAEVLDMTLDEVKQSLKNAGRHVSMDATKDGDDSSSTMYDVLQTNDTPCRTPCSSRSPSQGD